MLPFRFLDAGYLGRDQVLEVADVVPKPVQVEVRARDVVGVGLVALVLEVADVFLEPVQVEVRTQDVVGFGQGRGRQTFICAFAAAGKLFK